MSINRRIAFGAAAGWFSRGVSIILGLVLLPVLFRHLPKDELGVWLLLQQSWAALGIFDLGFGATLTRRIAFAKGKSGAHPDAELSEASSREVADLVTTGSRVYHLLSAFTFLFSFAVGYSFLGRVHLTTIPHGQVWLAWAIICLGQAIGVWANVWNCVLMGIGYVGWDAMLGSLAQALTYLAQIMVVLCGGSLVALAVTAAGGALLQRGMMRGMARKFRPAVFRLRGQWRPGLLREMTPLALRAWLTSLGACLVLYTDQILITSMKGAQALPAYRATYLLVHNVNVVAGLLGLASTVFISQLWQANEMGGVHRLVERNARVGWITMLSASAFLLIGGPLLFQLWLGPGTFVGYAILAAFLVTETLDVQSYVVSASSRATEDEAFAFSSLAGGVLKLALSYLLARELGLLGVVLGTVIALAATNHWYMVYRGLRRLKMSLREYAATVLVPCGLLFPVLLGLLFLVRQAVAGLRALPQFGVLLAVVALLFGTACWFLVLEPDHRRRVLRMLGTPGTA
jgi:O-antigen/teichoic acid export membrane protein